MPADGVVVKHRVPAAGVTAKVADAASLYTLGGFRTWAHAQFSLPGKPEEYKIAVDDGKGPSPKISGDPFAMYKRIMLQKAGAAALSFGLTKTARAAPAS